MEQPYAYFLKEWEYRDTKDWKRTDTNKAVVLLEGSARWQVPYVLQNFRHFLGEDWNLYVFCTRYNQDWLRTELTGSQYNLAVLDVPRINTDVFNKLYLDPKFWESIPEEHVLTVQADCICCKPLEDKWLKYDMVGAPCGVDTFNGGLSLRKNSVMKEALKRYGVFAGHEPEDVFFTKCLRLMNANLPNAYDAAFFSVESYYYGLPFGVHGTDKGYHSLHVAERIVSQIEL